MSKLLTASLITLSATAVNAHPMKAPPPIPPWIEERHLIEPRPETNVVHEATWDISVRRDGNWTRQDVDADGHASSTTGKLSADQIKQLEGALAKASWKISYTAQRCAPFVTYDSFVIDGTEKWKTDTCNGLDTDSAKAVATIDNVLAVATSHKTVWVELERDAESWVADIPTFDVKLYTDGTYERHDGATRGHPASDATGRLTDDQMKQLHAAIDKAPWTVTKGDAACDAIGTTFGVYRVAGKVVWTQHVCQLEGLDGTSVGAVQLINKLLG